MSSQPKNSDDLIDLHVGSPIFPRSPSSSPEPPDISDNLIDSELPALEYKLQTAPCITPASSSRRTSVDVEDILITIDDEEEHVSVDEFDGKNEVQVIEEYGNVKDAFLVLEQLDDVLNASLLESDQKLDDLDAEEDTQQIVVNCLLELDNYLKALDSSYEETSNRSDTSVCLEEDGETESATPVGNEDTETGICSEEIGEIDEEEVLRNRLRLMEENYARFLATSGFVNRAYIDTELPSQIKEERELGRPQSACGVTNQSKKRQQIPERATVAVVRRKRPKFGSVVDSDEEIDWSWVKEVTDDVSRNVTTERMAHASCDRFTSSVQVEPCGSSSGTDINNVDNKGDVLSAAGTWLRSSMRRLRHLRLPNTDENQSRTERTIPTTTDNTITGIPVTDSTRPMSAPSAITPQNIPSEYPSRGNNSRVSTDSRSRSRSRGISNLPTGRARSSSESSRSRRRRSLSSSGSSLASSVVSTPISTPAGTPTTAQQQGTRNRERPCDRGSTSHPDMPPADSPLGHWPHSLSSMLACLGCTLGLFNVSRFAILAVYFGANFIFQFIFLSTVFGLPLFTLQLCLGQSLAAGVIDMWRISPLFQGVGVALLIGQALLGLYSIVGVAWMFVFFRDSFITTVDRYRWAEPTYRSDDPYVVNGSFKLTETIPDYFNSIVLQRHHLPSGNAYGTIKFQAAFNLAVVWMIVFVALSKGLRSYGKVVYVFTLLPVFGMFVLCSKILGLMPPEYDHVIFPETNWSEFFVNSKSWLAAAQETFLTWGMLGAAIMQIASHNKHRRLLQRDSSLVIIITFTILLLVAFLANTCVQILKSYGYNYLSNSFEHMSSYQFLRPSKNSLPSHLASVPVRYMVHNSFVVGEKVIRPGTDFTQESGYQVLRFATELIPATFALLGANQVSPFWAVLFYFVLILFGIAQQLAIWHCVITGIMAINAKVLKHWETTITFFSCACGFVLGLPMATELGVYVVYFMDSTVGGIWWLAVVIFLQIVAVFMVRGRPYSGDTIVTALFNNQNHPCLLAWAPPLLSFTWNVILPVALMVLCISTFKNGNFREMFVWHHAPFADYWPLWARQFGSILQLLPILCVPLIAVVQSYRYLNNGPPDILDEQCEMCEEISNHRIQLLYRPPIGEHMDELAVQEAAAAVVSANRAAAVATEDPPPKYTPPPSYTTATGARIAKFLRQSIRRSVRRLANVLGEGSGIRQRGVVSNRGQEQPPPPDYNAVLVEMNHTQTDVSITVPDNPVRVSTLERLRNLESTSTALTAAEVASILRSSFRRSTVCTRARNIRSNNVENTEGNDNNTDFHNDSVVSLSAENLIDSAAPIGETSLVLERLPYSSYMAEENKSGTDNTSSVI